MKINQKQKIFFLDNLSSLINAWIPFIQALDIIAFQSKTKKMSDILNFLKKEISWWENFFRISQKLPWVFNVFDNAMIETWEATGQIWKALEVIVKKEEKEFELNKKIKQALTYPIAIVIVTLAMLTVIMTYVIPKIEWIYKESNVNLPSLTQTVIEISHFFVNNIVGIIIWILLLWLGFSQLYQRNKQFKSIYDRKILDIPLFWELIKKKTLVHFVDFLSTLMWSWIIINKALAIIKWAMSNSFYAEMTEMLSQEVKLWNPLSAAMWVEIMDSNKTTAEKKLLINKNYAFPIELSTAVKIWEQTWTLSKMLQKTSIRYTKEIDNTVKNLSTMLEPIIIVVIGWIVWVIIMAILLPFLNMVNVIK